MFGSSRHLAIGPTSAISLMVGVSVAPLAMGDPVRYAQIATLSAFVVAAMCVISWLLRLSTLTSFISETVLLGFKAGAALSIAVTQIPALLGIPGGGHNFIERLFAITSQIFQVDPVVTSIGCGGLLLLWFGQKFLPGRPIALFVVVISIAFISMTNLNSHVVTVGEVPSGLPNFRQPALRIREVDGILPLAFAALLLSYIESVSAARTFAAKHGYTLDPRQELLGIGAANLATALGHGYPVAGGLSQSAVNDKAGARTPLALVFVLETVLNRLRAAGSANIRLVAATIDEVVHHLRSIDTADFLAIILEVMRIPGHGDLDIVVRQEAIERREIFRRFGDIMAFRSRRKIPPAGEARMADYGHNELAAASVECPLNPSPLSFVNRA